MAIELIKISELDETANVNSNSVLPVVYEGKTYKINLDNLKKFFEYFKSASYDKTNGQLIFGRSDDKQAILNTGLNETIKGIEISDSKMKLTKSDDTITEIDFNYITDTDYATQITGGTIKLNSSYATSKSTTGALNCISKTYTEYTTSSTNLMFISKGTLENVITGKNLETANNKVTSISSTSTDIEFPSAKCVYDLVGNINDLLEDINSGNGVS